ncbi:hypothetical protein [Psychroserpens sp. NJDZ02]|uniref:hypothetical protein n=1 Tax=Psychroserpens sp. NJDZ02 TaxID=2570561 RepID=UPI0010A8E14D|nr:hypothetical protein [Psychroserpens sp. NJDZ02]QCE40822.1 hypothetical protein E9099_05105 [Psychroserpens sp. NJDZ02]
MKPFIYIITFLAAALIIYNSTQLNFSSLFDKQSTIAMITILASLCAIALVQILRISKKIEAKTRQ